MFFIGMFFFGIYYAAVVVANFISLLRDNESVNAAIMGSDFIVVASMFLLLEESLPIRWAGIVIFAIGIVGLFSNLVALFLKNRKPVIIIFTCIALLLPVAGTIFTANEMNDAKYTYEISENVEQQVELVQE